MMKVTLSAAILAAVTTPASADWFARTDSGGELVMTGLAVNPDATNTAVYLTCKGNLLNFEVLTVNSAKADDLPDYSGTKIVLGYKTREGDQRKLGLDGKPIVSAGNALSIEANLSAEQSAAIATSVARGNRLDVEVVHPELSADKGVKKVFSGAFTTALRAMFDGCPGLKL
ncbi:hypothetical protein [Rhizobium phaseoli]|uniref:hypothetical protein n=1 Tax=Rhizobium phaseoli TaxID=396 RepID=UPI0014384597|nr:hypothetical protein [Rhizobium phaseoli]MDK4728765.1 hypothetical protein [Rhizobium phaseoli]NKE86847.1 hypothetical protein [Rhizobium phaseoli]